MARGPRAQGDPPPLPWLRHIFADGGYAGDKLRDALSRICDWSLEIVKRADDAKGFVVVRRRWVVERTLAWLGRRASIASAEAWVLVASIRLESDPQTSVGCGFHLLVPSGRRDQASNRRQRLAKDFENIRTDNMKYRAVARATPERR